MEPAYPAARLVAPRVQAYFARHRAGSARPRRRARLRRSQTPQRSKRSSMPASGRACGAKRATRRSISLAFVAPSDVPRPLTFAHPLTLDPRPLARLAPAVERPGVHLGVCRDGGELRVWGTTRDLPTLCVRARGRIAGAARDQVAARRTGEVRERRGAARRPHQGAGRRRRAPARLPAGASSRSSASTRRATGATRSTSTSSSRCPCARTAAAAPCSSSPSENDEWRESIVHPIPYAIDARILRAGRADAAADRAAREPPWQDAVTRAGRRARRPYRRRRRDDHQRSLRPARLRREDRAARRMRRKWNR